MKSLNEIENIIKDRKPELKANYHVSEIGIFGSYVRNEQNENSDIDILIEYEPGAKISLLDRSTLKNYMSDLLNAKADITRKRNIREELKENILNGVIYL